MSHILMSHVIYMDERADLFCSALFSVLLRVAVCCSVLQCVAMCCSVLQLVPNHRSFLFGVVQCVHIRIYVYIYMCIYTYTYIYIHICV